MAYVVNDTLAKQAQEQMDQDYLVVRHYATCADCGGVHAMEDDLRDRARILGQVRSAVRSGEVSTEEATMSLVYVVNFTRVAARSFIARQRS